jgi:hypothetical protein
MTNNQFYLHSSPSGIKLIEGDKMQVRQERPGNLCRVTCGQWLCQCHLYADQCQEYESAIQRAKEQAVTVADQEKAKDQIAKLRIEHGSDGKAWDSLYGKEGTIYGPFSLRYEIQTLHYCKQCGAYKSIKRIPCQNAYCGKTSENVAILYDDTPEKERPGLRDALREVKANNKELRDSYKDPTRLDFRIKDSRGFPTGEVVEEAKITPEKEESQRDIWKEPRLRKLYSTDDQQEA